MLPNENLKLLRGGRVYWGLQGMARVDSELGLVFHGAFADPHDRFRRIHPVDQAVLRSSCVFELGLLGSACAIGGGRAGRPTPSR